MTTLYRTKRGRTWHLRKDGQGGYLETQCGMRLVEVACATYRSDDPITRMPPGKFLCKACRKAEETPDPA